MKRIAILLACMMLAGCTAMPTGTVSSDMNTNGAEAVSKQLQGEDSVSSNASSAAKRDLSKAVSSKEKTENTSSVPIAELSQQERAAYLKKRYRKEYNWNIAPVLSPIEKDPCIVDTKKVYLSKYTLSAKEQNRLYAQLTEAQSPIKKSEKRNYARLITAFNWRIIFNEKLGEDQNSDYAVKSTLEALKYYGEIDGYRLFYYPYYVQDFGLTFIRLGGYQFQATELCANGQPNPHSDPYDAHGDLRPNLDPEKYIRYTGLYLIKGDRVRFLEQLYLDGEIGVETVAKVYEALPISLQHGKFEHYQEAFDLLANNSEPNADYKQTPDYISYYDRDGKFHVVVA